MLVPDEVRQSVVFIGYRDQAGTPVLAGTAFFVASELDDIGMPDRGAMFLVTAQHVVDTITKHGGQVVVRVNMQGGTFRWLEMPVTGFLSHPRHPLDEAVDVAVAPVGVEPAVECRAVPTRMFLTEQIIQQDGVGLGDEVFVSGLFWNHHGKERNLPIVRIGNIAGMPEEKVETRFGLIDAYLVEARSIGGLSGSPVFVHLGLARAFGGQVKLAQNTDYGVFYLMGVMQGHFDSNSLLSVDGVAEDALDKERVNMGIAIVTPITKVADIMNRPEAQKHRDDVAANTRKEKEKELPSMDSAPDDSSVFTKTDFEDALKKVSRKLSDEEKSET